MRCPITTRLACGQVRATAVFTTIILSILAAVLPRAAHTEIPILTRSYDNERTGANTRELVLTPERIMHGLKLSRQLRVDSEDDPHLEAQPLYVPKLEMLDHKLHNVLYICTMANSVYAFDVDTGETLWKIRGSLGDPVTPNQIPDQIRPRRTEIDFWGTNDHWGILSTPVIDLETKTMYVVAWTSPNGTVQRATHFLYALDIVTGRETRNPLLISARIQGPKGPVEFIGNRQKQRAALLLTHTAKANPHGAIVKLLYIGFGQTIEWQVMPSQDRPTAEKMTHGWLIAVDVDRFAIVGAWPATEVGEGGGIWQGGQGPAADADGNVYVMTSNGAWDGRTDFSETLAKVRFDPALAVASPILVRANSTPALELVDWFTPFVDRETDGDPHVPWAQSATIDQDFGSGGPVLPLKSNFVLGAGKDGILYVLPRERLSKQVVLKSAGALPAGVTAAFFTYLPGDFPGFRTRSDPITPPKEFAGRKTHSLHGSPVSWTSGKYGPMLFVWGENGPLIAWALAESGKIRLKARSNEVASQHSAHRDAMFGGMLSLSSNGSTGGVIWATVPLKGCWQGRLNEGDAHEEFVEGIAYAYDANEFRQDGGLNTLKLLWSNKNSPNTEEPKSCESAETIDESRFTYNKFCPPVVADGKLFITTGDGRLLVFQPK